jgi:hypothetical protein
VPARQEPGQRLRLDRLDLAPQPGQRAAAQQPQDVGVAPLAFHASGPELTPDESAGGEETLQLSLDIA